MILDKPSKLREIAITKQIEIDALYIASRIKIEELISEIGLSGLIQETAFLCEKECSESKDQTLNFIAVELQLLAQKIAMFRDICKVEERKKE